MTAKQIQRIYKLGSVLGLVKNDELHTLVYLASLAFQDSVVRTARIEAAVLDIDGITDISSTELNGSTDNITLSSAFDDYQVPVIGSVTITEAANV